MKDRSRNSNPVDLVALRSQLNRLRTELLDDKVKHQSGNGTVASSLLAVTAEKDGSTIGIRRDENEFGSSVLNRMRREKRIMNATRDVVKLRHNQKVADHKGGLRISFVRALLSVVNRLIGIFDIRDTRIRYGTCLNYGHKRVELHEESRRFVCTDCNMFVTSPEELRKAFAPASGSDMGNKA